MAKSVDILLHLVVLLTSIQVSSAYGCYGYCWYSSWYIWIGVLIVVGVCCGGLGGYLRRRRMRLSRQQTTTIVTTASATAVPGTYPTMPTSDLSRPYVYPVGGHILPDGSQAPAQMMMPPPYPGPEKSTAPPPPSYDFAVNSPAGNFNPAAGNFNPAANLSDEGVPSGSLAPYPTNGPQHMPLPPDQYPSNKPSAPGYFPTDPEHGHKMY